MEDLDKSKNEKQLYLQQLYEKTYLWLPKGNHDVLKYMKQFYIWLRVFWTGPFWLKRKMSRNFGPLGKNSKCIVLHFNDIIKHTLKHFKFSKT